MPTETIEAAGGEAVGAVGQVISAAMQTLGLYSQSTVLNSFMQVADSVGAFVYIVAVLGAILSVALFGNYRKGIYLLIGPTLFWWVLESRIIAEPTAICVGNRCEVDAQLQSVD
ncbi:MAG: hypothetical protein KDD44_11505, partial [Bdellovibrionales bacterium]|nr:hypothetical protein [Bdellovibrionales bacterium]